ncbi:hypothetical protein PUN28_010082 [Cardiocondyla obscurior]|uniref:G-protein coupled receptors family 1 profile domain-containing protein n=1 Tax=Cardiocondyla obscurior TaxID=286306 RepID=A0AAW2FPD2_9HYME
MEFSGRYLVKIDDNITELMNLNESEYLKSIWGPKHLPLKQVLPITFVYIAIFVTGVFGNVVTCIVIRRNPVMQTATNYYLFNLAISDLLLLILGLPNELSVFWQQYPWTLGVGLCKIRAYVSEMSSYVSVLTIVIFSLERYLAICHPLHLYSMSGLKRPIRFILGAWLLALIFALPFAAYTTVNYIEYPPRSGRLSEESAMCAMLLPNMPKFPLYELSCLIFFFMPMLSIAVLYVRMGLRIQNNGLGRTIEGSVHGETRQAQSRKAIIRMLSNFQLFTIIQHHGHSKKHILTRATRFVAFIALRRYRILFRSYFFYTLETIRNYFVSFINRTQWNFISLLICF